MRENTLDKATPWLATSTTSEAELLLRSAGLLNSSQSVRSLQPAGQGNMNVTLRAVISERGSNAFTSLILKQSRPYVAKYQSIPAPINRIAYESAFYQFAADNAEIKQRMPDLVAWLPEAKTIILEDLGEANDGTCLYQDFPVRELPAHLPTLIEWLLQLHAYSRAAADLEEFQNLELRNLNHEHIFLVPFRDPPVTDLDAACPGLEQHSRSVRRDRVLRATAEELGQQYMSRGECLLHGDFYPGSWLSTSRGPFVIDPEFCYAGDAEFDWGILLAHLKMIGIEEPESKIRQQTDSVHPELHWTLIRRYAAVEILRRLLGVAQLPITFGLNLRMQLIEQAVDHLLHPSR